MAHLQVKNLPDELHEELRRRAQRRGITIRDYVVEVLRRDLERPALDEWLARVRSREPVDLPPNAVVDAIEAERAERGVDG